MTCQVLARQLLPGDKIPFRHGLEPLELDCQWAWVAEWEGEIMGILLLAPVHGSVMVVRLIGSDKAPIIWVRKVLTLASKDVLARGYKVAFTYFNLERPLEARLAKLLMGSGKGKRSIMTSNHALCATAIEDWGHGQSR